MAPTQFSLCVCEGMWCTTARTPKEFVWDRGKVLLARSVDVGDFLTTNAGSSAGLCESSFLQYTLQSRTRVGPIGIVGYNSTCIRFFFWHFFSKFGKKNLKPVVGSFFPNLEIMENYQNISKKAFLEILKTKLPNLEKSKSWPEFPNLEKKT